MPRDMPLGSTDCRWYRTVREDTTPCGVSVEDYQRELSRAVLRTTQCAARARARTCGSNVLYEARKATPCLTALISGPEYINSSMIHSHSPIDRTMYTPCCTRSSDALPAVHWILLLCILCSAAFFIFPFDHVANALSGARGQSKFTNWRIAKKSGTLALIPREFISPRSLQLALSRRFISASELFLAFRCIDLFTFLVQKKWKTSCTHNAVCLHAHGSLVIDGYLDASRVG